MGPDLAPRKTVRMTVLTHIGLGKPMQPLEVDGEMVAPGLAIAPAYRYGQQVDGRWTLTHMPSGLAVAARLCCRSCVEKAARIAVSSGVKWSRREAKVRADPMSRTFARQLVRAGLALSCADACDGR